MHLPLVVGLYLKVELSTLIRHLQLLYLEINLLTLHTTSEVKNLSKLSTPDSSKGKYVGVLVLTVVLFLNGAIHTTIGAGLAFFGIGEMVYNLYTVLYGILQIIFLYGLWNGKTYAWIGTILVSIFIILIDVCTTLGIQIIPGVPTSAAIGEIVVSLGIIVYLFQPKIKQLFLQKD